MKSKILYSYTLGLATVLNIRNGVHGNWGGWVWVGIMVILLGITLYEE